MDLFQNGRRRRSYYEQHSRRLASGRMSDGAESLVRLDNVLRHAKASERLQIFTTHVLAFRLGSHAFGVHHWSQ